MELTPMSDPSAVDYWARGISILSGMIALVSIAINIYIAFGYNYFFFIKSKIRQENGENQVSLQARVRFFGCAAPIEYVYIVLLDRDGREYRGDSHSVDSSLVYKDNAFVQLELNDIISTLKKHNLDKSILTSDGFLQYRIGVINKFDDDINSTIRRIFLKFDGFNL